MRSSLKVLPAVVVLALGCQGPTGPKGDPGEAGLQGPTGAVGSATPPLALSGGASPTLSISRATGASDGYLAASDFRALRATGGGNLLDWRSDLNRWANTCGVAPAVTLASDSQEGDSSFELNVSTPNTAGSCQEYGELIEIDPTATYYGQVWAKLVGGAGGFSAGFATYDASRTFIDNRYFIASSAALTVNAWVQLAGSIGGVGVRRDTFPAAARFVRPIVNPNFNNIGVTRVDGFKVFENVRRLPTLYRDGPTADQVFPNSDTSCGVTTGSPWTVVNGMAVTFNVTGPTEIELDFSGSMADQGFRTEGLHCALRYLIDGNVLAGAHNDWGHYFWSTNSYLWHGMSARRRALVPAGTHTVTVQGRSGLCSAPTGYEPNLCQVTSDATIGMVLEVVVP